MMRSHRKNRADNTGEFTSVGLASDVAHGTAKGRVKMNDIRYQNDFKHKTTVTRTGLSLAFQPIRSAVEGF